ncbi:MAG: bifunctional aspartate kinase/homoserine dehydrogenase I [Ferruginibacter sp.]|nr:bifunctional aspartate kinase/homoserine dehydrogenase I [Bacteroidota bacterium]MBX2920385.1 bifunctional aspartate kinase/homoserine dehydrogenase I [Ferruginibacter sp.]MCB0708330.1 bifunctional aspartate kinase/homoserine dehydrogenase I [Chitinophagaceae bacterium]MCC7379200.1 bifunctional aspartate kinase/homoserine dehydrogenase I [Chitinophagaceae bacterium]
MQVLKFGGSSVANAENINKVVNIIKAKQDNGKTIIVVSALGGITDKLLNAAQLAESNDESYKLILNEIENIHLHTVKELVPVQQQSPVLSLVKKMCNEVEDICNSVFILHELSPRIKDWVLSFGELLSSQIIAAKLNSSGLETEWKDSREIIVTDNHFGKAAVDFISTNNNALTYFQSISTNLFIIPGFIAADKNNITTTLGRGGSDYTAAIIAAAVDAKVLEIWTDVSGMMTADPRLVSNSKHIPQITYQEAMELSHFGAKVIYPPTMQPVMKKKIPVWIKNTFLPNEPGTVIENEATGNRINIQGISSINNIVLLSLEGSGMVGIPGFSKRLFEALANAAINVILITQGSSEHSICVGIDEHASVKAKEAVDMAFAYEIETGKVDPIIVESHLSIVAIVGDKMKNHSGISGKMFSALGRNGISIRAIAQGSSERNISAVISTQDVKKAINVLHEAFFETTFKQVNLFIAGLGNVGKRFLDQLHLQKEFLKEHLRMQVRVVGIANSKKMCFNEKGIDLANWQSELHSGQPMNLKGFTSFILSKNLRNTVFADITANEEIAGIYSSLLQKSISVIACNKVAASSSFKYYNELKELAKEYNCHFLFETNVGAGLPIIGTLKDLMQSGDSVHRIEAVLSGTLNFVFNKYNGTKSFASVVKQAQEEGYTEPDPRLDLSGKDVVRKILILARECGEKLEAEDICNNSFMPQSCMKGSVNDFYTAMEKEETHFKKLLDDANQSGKKLKFIASYDNGKASVGLKQVDERSDFFHLYGKDNVVLFYTDRYPEQPLVIKGAGAGAEVTASGVFADLLRATAV